MDRTTLAREAAPLVEAGLVDEAPGEDRRQPRPRAHARGPRAPGGTPGPPGATRSEASATSSATTGSSDCWASSGPSSERARTTAPVSFAPMYASLTTVRGARAGGERHRADGRRVDALLAAGIRRLSRAARPRRSRDRQRPHRELLGEPGGARTQRARPPRGPGVHGRHRRRAARERRQRYQLFLGKNLPTGRPDRHPTSDMPAVARFTTFEGPPESIEEGLRTFREDLVDWFRDATGFRGWLALLDAPQGRSIGITFWATRRRARGRHGKRREPPERDRGRPDTPGDGCRAVPGRHDRFGRVRGN